MSANTIPKVAALNEAFRSLGPVPFTSGFLSAQSGQWIFTAGVMALPKESIEAITLAVCWFDAFTEDNDPYGERDFGSIKHDGKTLFWKIDYYDRKLEYGSPDPSDPSVTCRVMTIMLAEEY